MSRDSSMRRYVVLGANSEDRTPPRCAEEEGGSVGATPLLHRDLHEITSPPDLTAAASFLELLGDQHTFQTFSDTKRDARLTRVMHGTLNANAATLAQLNARGAGIFVTVNETDGRGRSAKNIRRVRALFVDLDGARLEPVTSGPLTPHCVVETSRGRFHAYWLVSDCGLGDFPPIQRALAERFDGDPVVCDLPRVMRIPGFDHRKGEAFRSRLLEPRAPRPYDLAQIREAFGFETLPIANSRKSVPKSNVRATDTGGRRTLSDVIPEGERNATLFSLASGLARSGYSASAIAKRLQRINADRCIPPLHTDEVAMIATSASRYRSSRFMAIPHRLFDSSEWAAQRPAVHEIVLLAFRRYDGTETPFALTYQDMQGRPGFGSNQTFVRARREAERAGFIVCVSAGRNCINGRKPDLFIIAKEWRIASRPGCEKHTRRHVPKSHSYVDRQSETTPASQVDENSASPDAVGRRRALEAGTAA